MFKFRAAVIFAAALHLLGGTGATSPPVGPPDAQCPVGQQAALVTSPWPTTRVFIQSKNFAQYYFGEEPNPTNPAAIKHQISQTLSEFIITLAIDGTPDAVSLMSFAKPNHYLRHYSDSIIYLEDQANPREPSTFDKDASFTPHNDEFFPGFYSFESVNSPGHFIRHQSSTLKISQEGTSDLYKNDASWKVWQCEVGPPVGLPEVQCPVEQPPALVTPPWPTTGVFIQSKNYEEYYFGEEANPSNPAAITHQISQTLSEFIMTPAIDDTPDAVSFMSYDKPGHYLRHYGSIIYLEDIANPRNQGTFKQDASFIPRNGKFFPGYYSFESVNFPGRFIRHQGFTLKISQEGTSDLYKNDASWKVWQCHALTCGGPCQNGGQWGCSCVCPDNFYGSVCDLDGGVLGGPSG